MKIAALLVVAACSSPNGSQPATAPGSVPPLNVPLSNTTPAVPVPGEYAATAEFRVAIHEAAAGWGNPPAFWPCPIEGATFLCGTKQLLAIRKQEVVADPALQAGRPADTLVETVVGRWPADAWMIARKQVEQCGKCNFVAFQWQRDRWVEVAAFASLLPVTGSGALGNLAAAWNNELYVITDDGSNGRAVQVFSSKPSAIGQRIAKESRCGKDGVRINAIAANAEALFVVGAVCTEGGGDVTRWTAAGPTIDRLVDATASLNITAQGREAALFGGLFGEDKLVLHHFDKRWAPGPVKLPKGTLAHAYARAPDGSTEWMIVEDSVDRHPMVRTRGGDWEKPPQDFRKATATYGKTPRLGRMWIAEGSVWLEVFVDGNCLGIQGCQYRTLLLRTGATEPSKPITRERGTS